MIPSENVWIPPRKRTRIAIEAQPAGVPGSRIFSIRNITASTRLIQEAEIPRTLIIRSGRMEKLTNMLSHKETSLARL
jgi:hypothetical protein